MWSNSFPVTLLVAYGVLVQVIFASPVAIPVANDALYSVADLNNYQARDVDFLQSMTGGSLDKRGQAVRVGLILFNLARISSDCQQTVPVSRPTTPTKPEPPKEELRGWAKIWAGFVAIPKTLASGFAQVPKIWAQENVDAFKKSAGDLATALGQVPAAVKNGFDSLTNAQNVAAFNKSFGDLKVAVRQVPGALQGGAKDLTNPQNLEAFERSFESLKKGVSEIPGALEGGYTDLKKAPAEIAATFAKAPQQLTQAAMEFMVQFNRGFPPGSNQRKVFESLIASIPIKPDALKTFGEAFGMSVKDITDAASRACINNKKSLGLVKQQ
ncbi:hypothetical protein AA313_de0210110 [Arthrobotrys entomopaga]|nr:hypothetical protein AA313_de0210110 [Arthrobotrys entomopaga]